MKLTPRETALAGKIGDELGAEVLLNEDGSITIMLHDDDTYPTVWQINRTPYGWLDHHEDAIIRIRTYGAILGEQGTCIDYLPTRYAALTSAMKHLSN